MREYFSRLNKALWITFFIITPLTFIGLLAQNSIPGDLLYFVKRGFEGVGLTAFSFIPEVKADYTTELANNRFNEAEKMIVTKSDIQGLQALIKQVEKSKTVINNVSNQEQKAKLQQKLISSIDSYQNRLDQVRTEIVVKSGQTLSPTPQALQFSDRPIYQKKLSTLTPKPSMAIPSKTPTPALAPNTPQSPTTIVNSISETKDSLDEIKKSIEDSYQIQNNAILPTPTSIIGKRETTEIKMRKNSENRNTEKEESD